MGNDTLNAVRASLHVRGVDQLPDRAARAKLVAQAAEELARQGLRVLFQGRQTVTVEASPSSFRELFGLNVLSAPVSAEIKESAVAGLVDRLDVQSEPTHF